MKNSLTKDILSSFADMTPRDVIETIIDTSPRDIYDTIILSGELAVITASALKSTYNKLAETPNTTTIIDEDPDMAIIRAKKVLRSRSDIIKAKYKAK